MNTKMLIRVRKLFNNEFASKETNRYNQREWVKAIKKLGTNWLLHKQIEKRTDTSRVL